MGLSVNGGGERQIVTREPYNDNECVKLGTYNFQIVKDYTNLGKILTNKNELSTET
jgi:hypothetical protein